MSTATPVLYTMTNFQGSSLICERYSDHAMKCADYSLFTSMMELQNTEHSWYTSHIHSGTPIDISTTHYIDSLRIPKSHDYSSGGDSSKHSVLKRTRTRTAPTAKKTNDDHLTPIEYLAYYGYYLYVSSDSQSWVCNSYTQCEDYVRFTSEFQSYFGNQDYTNYFTYPTAETGSPRSFENSSTITHSESYKIDSTVTTEFITSNLISDTGPSDPSFVIRASSTSKLDAGKSSNGGGATSLFARSMYGVGVVIPIVLLML